MNAHARSTIRDVARKAKVSVATVSRVLNSPSRVRLNTREKVLNAMEQCHYVYNALAGSLSARKTTMLGVVIPTITNPIFATVTKGIQDYAARSGYSILLGNTDYNEENEVQLINLFQEKRIDGVIFNGPWRSAPLILRMKSANLPFVITWQKVKDRDVSFVAFDNFRSAYRSVQYLIGLGHRRIGMIAGKFSVSERALVRWQAYRKCLGDNGLAYDSKCVLEKGYSFSEGREAMSHLLSLPSPPSAVFCGNDVLAIGAMVEAKERGLRIPENLSVVGFDDMEISAFYDPPLTTVAVPAYEMGRMAAKILIENIRGESQTPQQHVLEANLIIRGSAGKAKK
ncbi:MAG: transcriptional regulator, LacI family [Deltaproteobacteria bacterium]|nr:transcriptional regulator, LacI family [Deltaproteobacteria bacterium]